MLEMNVKIMENAEALDKTEPFQVNCLLWGTKSIPKTYAYLGFVPGDGFYLKMVCEEKNPFRTYKNDRDPVYRDSAMEAFFQFESGKSRSNRGTYVNFEANSNGALLAAYGENRTYRSYFGAEEIRAFDCKASIEENQWNITLRIPIDILEEIYGPLHLGAGSRFRCNFYKISETEAIEHYASYSPVKSKVPSFHLPEFFAFAEIVEG